MTLVMGFATNEYVVFAADRRRTSIEDKNKYYDDMRKIIRVNDGVIIGFCGDFHITQECIKYLKKQSLNNATVQAVSITVKKYLIDKLKKDGDMQQTILIGGLGDGGKIILVSMNDRERYRLKKITPNINEIKWETAFADISPEKIIETEIHNIINRGKLPTVNHVFDIAGKSIDFVSTKDGYVSPSLDLDYLLK